jgi:hypothetical protein
VLGGGFLICSDSTMDLSSIARSVPRRLGGGVPVCNLADSSSWEVLVPPRGLFLALGDNTICFPLLFGIPAISISLPLALTDFVAARRFVEVCFAAHDGPFLGMRFWGSFAATTCRVMPGYSRHCAQACSVTMSLSKLNVFDRRCDEFDCLKQKSLIKYSAKLGKVSRVLWMFWQAIHHK